jgi:hypothetical protein
MAWPATACRHAFHRELKIFPPRLFNGFPGSRSTRPYPACYLEIGMRLAPTAQAATLFLAGQQALLLRW